MDLPVGQSYGSIGTFLSQMDGSFTTSASQKALPNQHIQMQADQSPVQVPLPFNMPPSLNMTDMKMDRSAYANTLQSSTPPTLSAAAEASEKEKEEKEKAAMNKGSSNSLL